MPEEIIGLEINNVNINNNNNVKITSYEQYEKDGNIFIKILTENNKEASYDIEIDCNITPNPKSVTTTKPIELYASNENCENYYYSNQDIYDVDGDLNTNENANYVTKSLNLVSPNSLLTSQEAKEFDENKSVVIAPQIAEVSKEQQTAKVMINVTNNYSNTISDVQILGKIPFENNKYILNGKDTGSNFTTTMTNSGIQLPESLKGIAKVYYSTNENPNKDLEDDTNGWTTNVEDYLQVKSFLIDISGYTLQKEEKQDFTYEIQIPEGIEYNKLSYSVHAVYYTLDTEQGKFKTQTESSKLGFMVAKKYDLELIKYQKNKQRKVSGATYSITEEGQDESKSQVTNDEGKLLFKGLYAEKTYIVREVKSPTEYVLNEDEIKFTTQVDNNGNLSLNMINGDAKSAEAIKQENENYKIKLEVEDEVKANLEIVKINQNTNEKIKNIKYKITGEGLGTNGKVRITNKEGKINLQGIYLNKEYTIEEIKATGYYLASPIVFKVTEENGAFKANILSGIVKESKITTENEIPTINLKLDNEPIPTYDIELIKKEKDKETTLQGAQFKLEGEGITTPKYYTTDENGKLLITGLYQYVEGKNLEAEYTLTEIYAPEGYTTGNPIRFKAQVKESKLQLIVIDGTIKGQETKGETIQITIENKPIFKLTKQDRETGKLLPNAKFKIYEINDDMKEIGYAKDPNNNIIGDEITTDENGQITCAIKSGLYKAIETEAPEGYQLPKDEKDRTYYFGVDKGQEAKYSNEFKVQWENTEKNYAYQGIITVEDGVIVVGTSGKVVKYDLEGNVVWENEENITYDSYYGVTTIEGGVIILGNKGQLVKYDLEGNVVWKKEGIESNGSYFGITAVEDGVIIVCTNGQLVKYDLNGNVVWENTEKSYFYESITTVKDGVIATAYGWDDDGGQLVKYDLNGNVVWENTEKNYGYQGIITVEDGVIAVSDSGKVVKYNLEGNVVWENSEKKYSYYGITIVEDGVIAAATNRYGEGGGKLVKYDLNGNILWENTEKSYSYKDITTVEDGVIAVSFTGAVVKYGPSLTSPEIPQMQEIVVKNDLKQFNITTDVNEYQETINGVTSRVRGGNITGEGNSPYEKVTYGKDQTKEIKAIPDAGYKIINIIVNGEEIPYNVETDGSVILNKFLNVTEDKKVVVTFSNTRSNVIVHHMEATKNTDGSYEYTDTKLAEDESFVGTIGQDYTTSPRVDLDKHELIKDANGDYILPENSIGTYESDTKEVNYYYAKKEVPIIVHYYIEGTNQNVPSKDGKIVEDILSSGAEGAKYKTATSEKVSDKYELIKTPTNAEGILEFPEVVVTYYYKVKTNEITTQVKTHEETNEFGNKVQVEGGTISGKDKNPYEIVEYGENSTKEIVAIADEGYTIKSIVIQSTDENGNITEENIEIDGIVTEYQLDLFENVKTNKHVIVEFGKIERKVIVHYYIEGTQNKVPTITGVAEDIIKIGYIGDMYATKEAEEVLSKYELVETPSNSYGEFTQEDIVVIYYYRLKDTGVVAKYIDKLTNEEIAAEEFIEGKVDDDYSTNQKEIDGYTFVEDTNNTSGTMTEEQIEVKYYYIKNTNVIVKYVDKFTGEEILDVVNKAGKIGDSFDIEKDKKQIEGYTLIEEPEVKTGTMTEEDLHFTYYYAKNTKVIVKHLEQRTNEKLSDEETILGYEGKEYDTKMAEIENYTFVESTQNTSGNMTRDEIIVIYYYAQNTSARVQYIDRITQEILDEETAIGLVGDQFKTEAKDFKDYILVEQPKQKIVEMQKEEIVLKYYYIHISAGVIEKHIDNITGEILYNTSYEGNEADQYVTTEKEFEGYELVKEKYPENSKGNMTIEPIEVKYYYKKIAKVTTKYVDIITEKEIDVKETQIGHEADEYNTQEKQIDNYVIVKENYPQNNKGKMQVTINEDGTFNNEIIVTYYYVHKSAGVIEKHIDNITNKVLEEVKYEGNEGDSYTTNEKEFEGYELVKEKYPNNKTGNMTKEQIEVDYYYIRKGTIKVEYIDKITGEILDTETIEGYEKDEYSAKQKKYDGYDLEEVPENIKGIINPDKQTEVKFYYIRKAKVVVKYLENGTDQVLEKEDKIEGHQNDQYGTKEKEIKYYKLVEEKYPSNNEGIMEVKKNEDKTINDTTIVTYYYEKLPFNMKVEKWIDKVTVNGKKQKGNEVDNNKIVKVEIHRKEAETSEIKITYKIRITNTEKLDGYVGKVIDKIPKGLIFKEEDNEKYWTMEGNTITADLSKEEIKTGKQKDLKVVLQWDKNVENLEVKTNKAQIKNVTNAAKFSETTTKDNESETKLLITVSTGENMEKIIIQIQAVLTSLIIIGASMYILGKSK